MVRSFRFWCLLAAIFSIIIAIAHVIGGGPEFHDPALASELSAKWKAAFSTVWHEITALLILNGAALIAAAMAFRKNLLLLWLVLLLNLCFTALFLGYGVSRLGTPMLLPQWIAFAALAACVAFSITLHDPLQQIEDVKVGPTHFLILPSASFADSYIVNGVDAASVPAAARQAFGIVPIWILKLMALRNYLVRPFGLIHANPPKTTNSIGMFPVLKETKDLLILGLDDRHLDFRIVLERIGNGQSVSMTTLVKSNNVFGKIYLKIILPFHRLIVATFLTQMRQG